MSELNPASHLADILSGHRRRIVNEYGRMPATKPRYLRYVIQDATDAFEESYLDVWDVEYRRANDDRGKELARFVASCIYELLDPEVDESGTRP